MKGFNTFPAAAAACVPAGVAQAQISDDVLCGGMLNETRGVSKDTNCYGSVESDVEVRPAFHAPSSAYGYSWREVATGVRPVAMV